MSPILVDSGGPGSDLGADLGVLAAFAPELARTFASVASDVALVIGKDGVVRSVALGDSAMSNQASAWVGQRFVDTVTQDTRGKIHQLLADVDSLGMSRRREVNLPGADGLDIPMAFAAIRLGIDGPVLAVGRDLRAIAAIQQRFVEAQRELEQNYWQQRQTESRYRLLFQVATDAVLVVDAATLLIVEANRAAADLLACTPEALAGRPVSASIDAASRPAVDELLVRARASGQPAEIRARLGALPLSQAQPSAPGLALVDISATPFRATHEGSSQMLLLVRARGVEQRGANFNDANDASARLAEFVEHTPDAVVITDSAGRVQIANPAFLLLCPALLSENQVIGRTLADVLGDPSHRLAALVAEVRRNGIATRVRAPIGHFGHVGHAGHAGAARFGPTGAAGAAVVEVEVSAALMAEGDQECIGFTLRRHGVHNSLSPLAGEVLASAIDGLAAQLGRVSLPELLQQATELAEGHLIRTAMAHAQGQVDAAADWLGISTESLALRLRRHDGARRAGPGLSPALLN